MCSVIQRHNKLSLNKLLTKLNIIKFTSTPKTDKHTHLADKSTI